MVSQNQKQLVHLEVDKSGSCLTRDLPRTLSHEKPANPAKGKYYKYSAKNKISVHKKGSEDGLNSCGLKFFFGSTTTPNQICKFLGGTPNPKPNLGYPALCSREESRGGWRTAGGRWRGQPAATPPPSSQATPAPGSPRPLTDWIKQRRASK